MNEENQNQTTANQAPKKKGGKAKKIIIAVVLIAVIAAIVVGVLMATGVIDLNLSKKSKMAAGVDQLTESITAPIEAISKASEENGTTIKILDNMNADSAIGISTEISGNIEELDSEELSSSDKASIDLIKNLLEDVKVGADVRYDGNESLYMNVNGTIEDVELSGEVVYDGSQVGMRSEELSQKWLTLSEEDLEDLLEESGATSEMDLETAKKVLSETMNQVTEIAKAANVDEKTQQEIQERYEKVLKDFIEEKSKDIESEKDKVEVDGKEKSCDKLTLEFDEKDIKKLLNTYIDTFKDDKQIQDILKKTLEATAKIAETTGETVTEDDVQELLDEMIAEMDTLKEEVDAMEFEGKLVLTVYATNTNIYRTDISLEMDGTEVLLETTFNKDETVCEIKVKSSGVSMDVATIRIKSEENSVTLKIELGKAFADQLGTDAYLEVVYKTEKSKSELSMTVEAGDYGHGTISMVTDITKNEDKEYEDTTKLTVDVDVPEYIVAKMSLNVKTNIKVGDVSIPKISSADSIDMTDETELQAYATEIEPKLTELSEKLMKIEAFKDIFAVQGTTTEFDY